MADLTANFGADFSKFSTAVQQAEAELKGFDDDATRVQGTLNRMVDSFSGRKLIQDAEIMTKAIEDLGGAANLTEAELARVSNTVGEAVAKMDKMGIDVPEKMRSLADETRGAGKEVSILSGFTSQLGGMIAGAFTLNAIIGFAKGVAQTADEINKTAAQTGMLTDEIQGLQAIANDTGVEFKTLISASQGLQAALGSNDAGVIGGIKKLGINFEEFKQLGTYDQMIEIGEALAGIHDPTQQAAAAAEIFGNKWKEILPALLSDMESVGEAAPKMSAETIAALDQLDQDWNKLKATVTAWAGETVGALVRVGVAFESWMDQMTTAPDVWNALFGNAESIEAARQARLALRDVADGAKTVGESAAAATPPLVQFGNAGGELAKKMRESYVAREKKDIDEHAAASRKAAEEMKAWAAVYAEVEAAGTDWHATLAGLDEQLVAHIQLKLEAGVASEKLAKAYGLSAEQMTAIKNGAKEYNDEQERGNAIVTESARLDTALTTQLIANTGSRLEVAIAALRQESELYRQSMQEKGVWNDTLAAQEQALLDARIAGLLIDKNVLEAGTAGTRQALEERAQVARATADAMIADANRYSTEAIAAQEEIARAAEIASLDISNSAKGAGEAISSSHRAAAEAVTLTWSQAMDAVRAGQGSMTTSGGAPASSNEIRDAAQKGNYYGPVDAYGNPDYSALGLPPPSAASGWSAGNTQWGHRAGGGPVSAGSPYVVGEKGPELFVPGNSGSIVPNGGVGGGGVVANIYVNGTGADVARVINAELTRLMRVGRKWPSV